MKVGMRLMRDKHSSQIIKSYSADADASAVQRFGLVLTAICLQLSIYNDTWHVSHLINIYFLPVLLLSVLL